MRNYAKEAFITTDWVMATGLSNTYTVGQYGIDDTDSIRVMFRFVEDWGKLQTTDPAGDNYVTAHASNGVELSANVCALADNCCQYVVVEHNGDIYPCDFFV